MVLLFKKKCKKERKYTKNIFFQLTLKILWQALKLAATGKFQEVFPKTLDNSIRDFGDRISQPYMQ